MVTKGNPNRKNFPEIIDHHSMEEFIILEWKYSNIE